MKRENERNDRRDGKGRPEGRREDVRGGYNKGGERQGSPRPTYGDRPRTSGPGDRPAYGGDRNAGPRKPFNREGGNDRPAYGDRDAGPRKPFNREGGDRPAYGDRKPFNREGGNDRPAYGDRKPFNREGGNDRPAYGDRKPFNREGGSDRPSYGDRKPFNREGGDRPAYGDRKPFNREGGDRPSYGDRDAGPRKPFNREGGNDRPAYGDRKPFNREDGDRPAYGDRNAGPRKPFNREGDSARFDRPDRQPEEQQPETGPAREREAEEPTERRPYTRANQARDERRNERPRPERREGENPADDRPARKPYDQERTQPSGDRPAYGDRDAGPRKPFNREGGNDRPAYGDRKPFTREGGDGPAYGDRKPFNREGGNDRPAYGDRKPFSREGGNDRRNSRESDNEKAFERRTGRYESAPNYNLNSMRDNLPRSRKVAKNLARERETDPNSIRLNRYIANAGICSRREADELIAKGDVQINGKVITEMGHRVRPGDVVKYANKVLNAEKMVYVLLNKPRDIITTTEDPEARGTVMDLIADAGPFRLYPVGRLDRNTTGLLLMTNDGELAGKLTHPSHNVKKVYQVELDKPISEEHFEAIRNGMDLEDGHIKPDDLAIVTPDAQVVGVEIHSGRNRIVRRMFESLGYEVTKLDRTVFAGLTKKELPRGKWRFLDPKEVVKLKYLT